MYFYCIVVAILHCQLKEAFLYRNFQLGAGKVSANCPLDRGFLIRILYETNPFLKSVRWNEVSAIKDVRYREVSLYLSKIY